MGYAPTCRPSGGQNPDDPDRKDRRAESNIEGDEENGWVQPGQKTIILY
ncbi:MAG: hypothetical protein JO333_01145 [Verrucomicrobia bacterium]|nr:hypothetical protein [Verrucomicrobiota bacterium]